MLILLQCILLLFEKPTEILEKVEWNTIFFFVGLFIIIGGLEASGGIKLMADWLLKVTAGSQQIASYVILWASGILSGIIDNIPYRTLLLFDLYKLRLRKDVNYDSFLIYVENDYKESEKLLFQYLTPLSNEVVYITNRTVSEIIKDKKILICLIFS